MAKLQGLELSDHFVVVDEVAVSESLLHPLVLIEPKEAGFALEEKVHLLSYGGVLAAHEGDNDAHDAGVEHLDFEATGRDATEFKETGANSNPVLGGSRLTCLQEDGGLHSTRKGGQGQVSSLSHDRRPQHVF